MADDIFKQKVEKHSTDFQHVGDYFDFWFDTIHCHQTVYPTNDKQQDNLVDPPVIVVFTGKDKLKKENLEKTEEEIKIRLGELLRSQTKYQHLRNIFFISNTTDPDEPFEELRQEISVAATKMPNWGELMPLKWILLEHLIEINKENGKKITSLFEIIKMAEHPDINVHESKDVLLFLRFQHVIGNIIYFEDIPDLIILNPQWLVDAFRCLASNKYDAKPQQLKDWIQFVQYGQLSDILITELFKSKCGEHFLEQRDNVLKVMEKFDILVKKKDSGFYIMPSKMPFSSFDEVCDKIGVRNQNCKRTSWLCLKFEFLPPAFYNHLAVWFIKHYNPTKMQNEGKLVAFFRGICIFDINSSGCEKLLVAMSTDTIALQILSFSTEDKEFGSPCSTIYKELFSKVEAIIERYDLTITFDVCFKCNKGDFHKDATPYKDLQKNAEFYCLQHQQAHKSEELYLPWMKNAYESVEENTEMKQINFEIEKMVENGSTDSLVIVPVKKNSAISARKLVVVAIELGTFFSQYAYSDKWEFITNPLQFRSCYWPNEHHSKAPSVLLFNPDKSFNSFGYTAQRNYFNLLEHDPDKAATYYFVKNFKIQLFNKKIGLEMMIKDISGKELSAITVFTEAIRFLKDHFIGMFTTQKLNLSFKDVFFVVPVPATWNKSALQFMMVASEKAGIKSSQMTLVYEPDVVVLYYSMLPEDQSIARYLKEGHRIMIVNIGEDTTDITVVKVIKRKEKLTYIEHVYKVSRVACEVKQVNARFEYFLESVFGIDVIDEYKRNYRSQYLEMISDFELVTVSTSSKHIGVSIRFGGELRHIYKRKRGNDIVKDIENMLNNSVRIIGDKLQLNISWLKSFFQDCQPQILNHINETIFKTECVWPSALIVDGKYSDAPLIQEAIVDTFPLIKDIFFPRMSASVLIKGSVIFGHEPAIVTCRVCRETLGLTFRLPYVLEGQTEKKTFKINGKLRAYKSFQKMFSINEIIELEQIRTVAVQDIHTHKELLKYPRIIEVYASQDEDPKYITDDGCSLRGKITVNPPNGEWPEHAEGLIDMETEGTEIIVRYRDKHSCQITEETIDFM